MSHLINKIKNLLRPWKTPLVSILLLMIRLYGGNKVISGPFKGLRLPQKSPTKPMLLGVWEKELSFIWDSLQKPIYIIDVGAAEGYYAVGLAKKFPEKKIIAFEMSSQNKILLQNTIRENSVNNVEVYGKCEFSNLNSLGLKLDNSILIMDCEGYEIELLKNFETQIFHKTQILVELHEMYAPGCTLELKKRFKHSHKIKEIKGEHREINDWPSKLNFLRFIFPEKLLLLFMDEGRPYPMNWLYMSPKVS